MYVQYNEKVGQHALTACRSDDRDDLLERTHLCCKPLTSAHAQKTGQLGVLPLLYKLATLSEGGFMLLCRPSNVIRNLDGS